MRYWNRSTNLLINGLGFNNFDNIDWSYQLGQDDNVGELTLQLFNLSDESIEAIKKGKPIQFDFGYEDSTTVFFSGVVDSCYTDRKEVTSVTSVIAYEYSVEVFKKISRSYVSGTNSSYVIKDICNQCGFVLKEIELGLDVKYNKGYTVYDMPLIALKKVAGATKSKLKIVGNSIWVYKNKMGTQTGIEFNYESGLINAPQEIQTSRADSFSNDPQVANPMSTHTLRTFANPSVKKNDIIKALGQTYLVNSINISDWISEMEVLIVD